MESAPFLRRLARELRHGLLPIWVLDELSTSEALYGYELLARLRTRGGSEFPVGPSALYPTLSRLRSMGLIETFHGTVSLGPIRKYYRLTPAGRESLFAAHALADRLRPVGAAGRLAGRDRPTPAGPARGAAP